MHEIILCKLGEVVLKGRNRRSLEMKPVSYTHLEVYKRQAVRRSSPASVVTLNTGSWLWNATLKTCGRW